MSVNYHRHKAGGLQLEFPRGADPCIVLGILQCKIPSHRLIDSSLPGRRRSATRDGSVRKSVAAGAAMEFLHQTGFETGFSLMYEKDVICGVDISMTAKTTHPATEPGTLPVPRLRVSALGTALAGVRWGDGHDRLTQCLSLVGQESLKEVKRPTVDITVEPSASPLVPDTAQILEYECIHPGHVCDFLADHMTHISAEPHFPSRHGAQAPLGGSGAFCLQCASVVAVAPLRGSRPGVLLAVRSDGELPDTEVDAQPAAYGLGRGISFVVEVEPESIASVVLERGGLASPATHDGAEVFRNAQDHSIRRDLQGGGLQLTLRFISLIVEHDPESFTDAGQRQKVAAHSECANVVPDTECVLRWGLPLTLCALVAPFGRLKRAVSRRLEDGGRNLRVGFPDAAIESLMGFLFTVGSILGRPLGVSVENLDARFKHWKELVLREIWTQRHCTSHFHMLF